MYSNFKPFTDIVDAIKDGTGMTNLRNLYPTLRRHINRAEGEIGYGGSLLMKRITYCTEDGTILNNKIKLPSDFVSMETVGMCSEGICPEDYRKQGNFLFLCKDGITAFSLIYYALICDGEGNPVVTENHFEAVVAGIKFFLYQPKMWNNEGNMNFFKELETYYEDRIGEARGNDVFPNSKAEWAKISEKLRMSQRDMLMYSTAEQCYCCIDVTPNTTQVANTNEVVYDWQYENLVDDISIAPAIDQAFLDLQNSETLYDYSNGMVINYTAIGRIAFALKEVDEDEYQILDVFGSDITAIVFDTYYNTELKTQIYISKSVYTHGNVYFKILLKNV